MKHIQVLTFGCLFVGACSADPIGSEADARAAWEATNTVFSQGPSAATAVERAISASNDVTVQCAQSGKATFAIDVNTTIDPDNFDPTAENSTTVDYKVTFKRCKASGTKINGEVDYSYESMSGEEGVSLQFSILGELTYSGNVKGSCAYDLYFSFAAGGMDFASADIKYEGSICGYDASTTLNTETDA